MGFYGENHKPPHEIPAGFLECITPLADWMKDELKKSYEAGYVAGRLDSARSIVESREKKKISSLIM